MPKAPSRFTVGQFFATVAIVTLALPFAATSAAEVFVSDFNILLVAMWLGSGTLIGAGLLIPLGGVKYPLIGAAVGFAFQLAILAAVALFCSIFLRGLNGV